ncbi:hypothetical protein CFK38_16250 [Brachybacterium vulturis]|uniref:Uncharacterized protein n=1 Tax=Brachybacterium vulturis TaxID=2017484 RepID=A0A291GRC2_9MICO|nr:hypothetical protein [Brachybacterium vulturis]ATG52899.1 hypothetical protein CFK38_16250 [Brachybacterium vulturis]
MLPLLAELSADPATMTLLAGSDSGAGGIAIPFIAGPAVFAAVYGGIYRYYRNTDKRHHFERETEVSVGNLRSGDRKVGENNRQQDRAMRGRNSTDHLQRVHRIAVD